MEITRPVPLRLGRAFIICALSYIAALFVAVGVGNLFHGLNPVYTVLLADIAGTLVIFIAGRLFQNASFYDPYWSIAPIIISLFWIFGNVRGNAIIIRQVIAVTLVFIWGFRLTFNWARRWRGFNHEDWRYVDFRNKTGKMFWLVELLGIEMMPTVIVFLGCLPLYPALSAGRHPFGVLDIAAIVITLGAILTEAIADEQLRNYMKNNHRPEGIMAKGLWAYSRHPNYLGEVAFWWGIFFFGLAADLNYWWTIIGPVVVTALFTTISIPMIEKRNLARRPGYAEVQKRISPLLLWFPKK